MRAPRSVETRTRAVGVVVPVNNEEVLLPAALAALERALNDVISRGLRAHAVVVLDSCRDQSQSVARAWKRRVDRLSSFGVTVTDCDRGNVGAARALGCDVLLGEFRDVELERVWLATTDADSRVPPHWLRSQLTEHDRGADAWAGRVRVTEWPRHRLAVADAWQRAYDAEARPIHGASFGVNARAYVEVGGFPPQASGEDRALHAALVARSADVRYDTSAPVVTSARRNARAPAGFAAALSRYDVLVRAVAPS